MKQVQAHRIKGPTPILAVIIIATVSLTSSLLVASHSFANSDRYLDVVFGAAAIVTPVLGFYLVYLFIVHHRSKLCDDEHLARHMENFSPANKQKVRDENLVPSNKSSRQTLEARRKEVYRENSLLFLVHDWVPSTKDGQIADVTIRLIDHQKFDKPSNRLLPVPGGPISLGEVHSVEYELGPKFFDSTVVRSNPEDNYRLDVAAFSPMVCVAKVLFKDETRAPLILCRYINFNVASR